MSTTTRTAPPTVHVSARGLVTTDDRAYAVRKLAKVVDATGEPVLRVSSRLEHSDNPANGRPFLARASIDVNGQAVRAHVAGTTMTEAIDLLEVRLRQRLRVLADHRSHLRHRGPGSPGGQWRHGDLPTDRPDYHPLPPERREIVRHKSFSTPTASIDEAIFDLEAQDYDFLLFTERSSGVDAMAERATGGCYEVQFAAPADFDANDTVAEVLIEACTAPPMTADEARARLDMTDDRYLFYRDAETGRGRVLYRRYDGHYGLITPRTEE